MGLPSGPGQSFTDDRPAGVRLADRTHIGREAVSDATGKSVPATRVSLPDAWTLATGELFARWRIARDRGAREELVRRHLSLARKLASRYNRTQEPFEDLFQVASLGLLKAIDRF